MLGAGPLIGLDRLPAENGSYLSQYATLLKPINLLKFADSSISDFSPNSKEFFFRLNCQEMLASPLIGLDRFSVKNGPDLN
jgi:hypothetical protein